jgi:hypothetical protein
MILIAHQRLGYETVSGYIRKHYETLLTTLPGSTNCVFRLYASLEMREVILSNCTRSCLPLRLTTYMVRARAAERCRRKRGGTVVNGLVWMIFIGRAKFERVALLARKS